MSRKSTIQSGNTVTSEPVTAVIQVDAAEFAGAKIALPVLGQLVVDLQHNQHHATAHTKTRGEVAGSTRKPWRQKGTGRARVGTRRTPLWRGGGRVFGPRSTRNFQHKINHKLLHPALLTALFQKAAAGEVLSIDKRYGSGGQTKTALQFFQGSLDPQSNLIITAAADPVLHQAVRNLPYVTFRSVNQVNLLDVVTHRHIIFLGEARQTLITRLNQ